MAKVLSHVWSSISGSVGGITYLNGPHAAIIARARVEPVQPGSIFQSQAKSAWNSAQGTWETLSAAVQDLWDDYALTVVHQGKQGNYTVTGRSMFMAGRSLQDYMRLRGLISPNLVTTAPVTNGFLLPSGFQLAPPVGIGTGFTIVFDADPVDDTIFFTQVSPSFGKERNFWKGPYVRLRDQATLVVAAASGNIDYLGLTLAKRYFVRVKAVSDDASPRVSQEWFGHVEAAQTGP